MKKSILTSIVLVIVSVSTIFAQYTNALRIKIDGYGYADETIIRFIDGATPDFDSQFDAWKLISSNPMSSSIYSTIPSNDMLSINSLPLFENDTNINLHTKVAASGLYTITIEEIYQFDSDFVLSITDVDAETTYSYNGGTLTFTSVLLPNTFTPTFKFNISKTFSTAIEQTIDNNEPFVLTTKGNGNFELIFDNPSFKNITIYDLTGKIVLQDMISSSTYNLNIGNNPSGLYIVTINNEKEILTKKVFR
ncbi:MAG: T9SS type A sorting domain-containing protein [Flavobacteriales bacterium]